MFVKLNDWNEKLIMLHHCRGISWNNILSILTADPTLNTLLIQTSKPYHRVEISKEMKDDFQSSYIREQISQYARNGIEAITYFDERYPPLLKEIYQPPWVIYVKGNLSLLNLEKKLAVVGARQATVYSRQTLSIMMKDLVSANIGIVSGLASGVDSIAHQLAIHHNGQTIAVIAGGIFHIYPKENQELASEIMKNHLLLSEYPPLTKPLKWHFPMRNRIISGLSNGTLIVEAKRKSGSLITANYAVNEGRDVFAIPGSILSPYSQGTNDLIKQGAKPVTSALDILEEWFY